MQTARKNAANCFEMYVEMIKLMKDLDPALFKMAMDILKRQFNDFKLNPVGPLVKFFPDEVPDVFSRLWINK